MGLVRIAQSGTVTTADVLAGRSVVPHETGVRVPPEDDVVAVDADDRAVALVTTHDESEHCPEGRGGTSVHVLRAPRGEGKASTALLSPAACSRDVGPFWMNPLGKTLVVAWPERESRKDKTTAPIVGLAYRSLEDGAALARVVLPADAMADAGCDASRCYALALVREPGTDGMSPEAIKLVAYP
jgi:hypothetical protein